MRQIKIDVLLKNASDGELKKLHKCISKLNPEKSYRIIAFEADKPRSLKQNRYLRAIEGLASNHLGYTTAEIHQFVKQTWCSETIDVVSSTASISTRDMTQVIENFRNWLLDEHNLSTPDPNAVPDEFYSELAKQGLI